MILAADSTNGVLQLKSLIEAEGYQIEAPEYFYDSLSSGKSIVSEIKSLSELKRIHKEFRINRY